MSFPKNFTGAALQPRTSVKAAGTKVEEDRPKQM